MTRSLPHREPAAIMRGYPVERKVHSPGSALPAVEGMLPQSEEGRGPARSCCFNRSSGDQASSYPPPRSPVTTPAALHDRTHHPVIRPAPTPPWGNSPEGKRRLATMLQYLVAPTIRACRLRTPIRKPNKRPSVRGSLLLHWSPEVRTVTTGQSGKPSPRQECS